MLIRTDTLVPWKGEALNGIRHAIRALEASWTDNELLQIGLVRVIRFIVPDGYETVGDPSYDAVGQETYDTVLIPPPTPEDEARDKEEAVNEIVDQADVLGRILFNLANRQPSPNLTLEEYTTWVRGL